MTLAANAAKKTRIQFGGDNGLPEFIWKPHNAVAASDRAARSFMRRLQFPRRGEMREISTGQLNSEVTSKWANAEQVLAKRNNSGWNVSFKSVKSDSGQATKERSGFNRHFDSRATDHYELNGNFRSIEGPIRFPFERRMSSCWTCDPVEVSSTDERAEKVHILSGRKNCFRAFAFNTSSRHFQSSLNAFRR